MIEEEMYSHVEWEVDDEIEKEVGYREVHDIHECVEGLLRTKVSERNNHAG